MPFFKMDILDAVKACTYTSAKSLMLEDTIGSIEEGKKADLIIWEIDKIEDVSYFDGLYSYKTGFKKWK